MSKFKTLLVLAAGYIAGSAAGRQHYEQIRAGAKRVADDPRVQVATKRAKVPWSKKARLSPTL